MHLDTRASRENLHHHGQGRPKVTLVAHEQQRADLAGVQGLLVMVSGLAERNQHRSDSDSAR